MASRIAPLAAVLLALLGHASQAATPPKSRTVTASYTAPGGVQDQIAGQYFVNDKLLLGGFTLSPTKRERRVSVTLTDTTGLAVPADLVEDLNGDGVGDVHLASFCTRTPGPVRLKHAGALLLVYVFAGTCAGTPASPTTGTAKATFSS